MHDTNPIYTTPFKIVILFHIHRLKENKTMQIMMFAFYDLLTGRQKCAAIFTESSVNTTLSDPLICSRV